MTAQKGWFRDAAAPLLTDRQIVEPLFRAIEARAIAMGVKQHTMPIALCADPGLFVMTSRGERLQKIRQSGYYRIFSLPPYTTKLHLVSRCFRPSESIGPFVNDRRLLGVMIGKILVISPTQEETVTTHLTETKLSGWHDRESSSCRWTSGNALLPTATRAYSDPVLLAVEILAGGPYPQKAPYIPPELS